MTAEKMPKLIEDGRRDPSDHLRADCASSSWMNGRLGLIPWQAKKCH